MKGWMYATAGLALGAALGLASKRAVTTKADPTKVAFSERSSNRSQRLRSGREVVLVLIGSSTCGASTVPELPAALQYISSHYRDSTSLTGGYVATVGVSLDWDLNAGLAFLNQMGSFDEVSLGRNWLNSKAIGLVWRDLPGDASLPQLVVLERNVSVRSEVIQVGQDSVVKRLIGVPAILRRAEELKRRRNVALR